ncbi:MAG: hypothetical protein SF052_16865 [Bacteroidia bacterium]|nr:hypothetical protein [Bacteroidia bacterium]
MKLLINKRILQLVFFGWLLPGFIPGFTQCTDLAHDTLFAVLWENGIPPGWEIPETSDGGKWEIGTGGFGFYRNPGSGNWIYVNDEKNNQIGRAEFLTPEVDFAGYQGNLVLSFFLNFQEYAGKGRFGVELGVDNNWVEIWSENTDFSGKVTLEVSSPGLIVGQFRFVFEDGGEWGWGMGLDEIILTGNANICNDGICGTGENPGICPEDCPDFSEHSPLWIPVGEDLAGNAVKYRFFKGGTACDDCSEEVELGFEFNFFGQKYRKAWLNLNGNLTFGEDYLEFTPEPFCLGGPRMIAPFFGDVDLTKGGSLFYYTDPEGHYFIATWLGVGYFGCATPACAQTNTFQVIMTDSTIREIRSTALPSGATIVFSYGDMQWTTGTSSGGVDGLGGNAATVGSNQGDGQICYDYGTFGREGYAYLGNSQTDGCPPNGIDHLDFRSVFVNGKKGDIVFPSGEVFLTGMATEAGNQLRWTIDLPEVVDYFIVERSSDKQQFEELEMVYGGSISTYYEYLDTHLLPSDPIWYRLTQIHSDGSILYSDTVEVKRNQPKEGVGEALFELIQTGPNPFDGDLRVLYEARGEFLVNYKLVDMAGRQHLGGKMSVIPGSQELHLQMPDLPAGIYVLTFFYPTGKTYVNLVHK